MGRLWGIFAPLKERTLASLDILWSPTSKFILRQWNSVRLVDRPEDINHSDLLARLGLNDDGPLGEVPVDDDQPFVYCVVGDKQVAFLWSERCHVSPSVRPHLVLWVPGTKAGIEVH